MRDFVAFDFETANYERFSICSVGFVFVEDGVVKDSVYQLINPETEFDDFNIMIHGITEDDVKNEPTFNVFYDQIKHRLENKILVAHYLPFDGYALRDSLTRYNISPVTKQLLCSYQLSKKLLPEKSSYALKSMCHHYSIELNDHHNALADAKACADLFLRLTKEFEIFDEEKLYEKTNIRIGQLDASNFITSRVKSTNSSTIDINSITINTEADRENPFYDKKVVFTGKLALLTRRQAFDLIASMGAVPQNGINKETDIIVLGNFDDVMIKGNKSSKLIKAEKMIEEGHKIEIISEEEFIKMLN